MANQQAKARVWGAFSSTRHVYRRAKSGRVVIAGYSWLDLAFVGQMYLLSLILSFIYVIYGMRQQFLMLALAINTIFFVLCLIQNLRVALALIGIIMLLVISVINFSLKFSASLSFAQLGSYPALFCLGLFGVYATRYPLPRALKLLFLSSLLYAATYLYLRYSIDVAAVLKARLVEPGVRTGFILSHDAMTGGDTISFRTYASDMNFAIGLFYSLAKLRDSTGRRWLWAAIMGIFAYCFIIADFRFAEAAALLVFLVSLMPVNVPLQIQASKVATRLLMLLMLMLAVFHVNIYKSLRNDVTGSVRYNESEIAFKLYDANPLVGIGLAGQADEMVKVVGTRAFAASDIGYLGMLCRFGLIGYAILYVANMVMHRFVERVQYDRGIDAVTRRCLIGLLFYVMVTQLLSTYILDGGGALLLVLAIAYTDRMRPVDAKRIEMRFRNGLNGWGARAERPVAD